MRFPRTLRPARRAAFSPVALALFGLCLMSPCAARSAPPPIKMSPDLLQQANQYPKSKALKNVIVRLASSTANPKLIARAVGGTAGTTLNLIHGAAMKVPYGQLKQLAALSAVAWVSPDRQVGGRWDYDCEAMGADQVWAGLPGLTPYKGAGVGVAVLDSGLYFNADDKALTGSASRLVAWKDFIGGKTSPYDDNGHGTHVAGIIFGNGKCDTVTNTGELFTGSAPAANLVAVKVLDNTGAGSVSTIVNALSWVVQNRATYNIRVINLSLGHDPAESVTTDPLCQAVENAVNAGIVVVCAAGNKGKDENGVTRYGGIECPGNDPSVITVGALNTFQTIARGDDGVCTFSSRGPTYIDNLPKPDVVAPGNKVVSDRSPGSYLDVNYPANVVTQDTDYYTLSGTSMATPEVAGVVALMLQANPSLSPNIVKAILMYTAQTLPLVDDAGAPLGAGYSTLTQGAGSVNAAGAVEVAAKVDTTQPVGAFWLKAPLSMQNTIGGQVAPWCAQLIYGPDVCTDPTLMSVRQPLYTSGTLWGNQTVSGTQAIWGNQAIWGDQAIWSDQAIWGNQAIWGDQAIWGNSTSSTTAYALAVSTLIHGD